MLNRVISIRVKKLMFVYICINIVLFVCPSPIP